MSCLPSLTRFPIRQIAAQNRLEFLNFGPEGLIQLTYHLRRNFTKARPAGEKQLTNWRALDGRNYSIEAVCLKPIRNRPGAACPIVTPRLSHGLSRMNMMNLRRGKSEAWNLNEVGDLVYESLRVVFQVVIKRDQNVINSQHLLPSFQMSRVAARFHQFGISDQSFVETPRHHGVGAL